MKDKALMEDMVYKVKADFLRALSYPIRLKIIEVLKPGGKVGILHWVCEPRAT